MNKRGAWAAAFLLAAGGAWAAGDVWMTDFDAAKKVAAEQKKDLLVDFSGSDWCGWCKKLDAEVFSQQAFLDAAPKKYVLVVLDFPQRPENKAKIPDALKKRNAELQKEYGIRGYPSVLLLDAAGRVLGRTGYRPDGPEAYLKHLAEMKDSSLAVEALLGKAGQPGIKPADKAKVLDEALQKMPEELQAGHTAEMEEIVKIDADGKLGLKGKYQMTLLRGQARAALESDDTKKAIEIFDRIVSEIKPQGEELQELLVAKGEAFFRADDKPGLRKCLESALAAAPDSKAAPRVKAMIKRFFPDAQP